MYYYMYQFVIILDVDFSIILKLFNFTKLLKTSPFITLIYVYISKLTMFLLIFVR